MERGDKKIPRRKAGDFHVCYVNYPKYTSWHWGDIDNIQNVSSFES